MVVAGPAGGVKVDHVQPLSAGGGVGLGDLDGVVRVFRRLREEAPKRQRDDEKS